MNDENEQIETGKALGANSDYLSAQSFVGQNSIQTSIFIIAGEGEDAFTKIRKVGLDCRDKLLIDSPHVDKIKEIIDFAKTELNLLEKLQIALVIYKNGVSYCSIFGGGQIYLVRGEKILEISQKLVSQNMISGKLHPGDEMFIINNRFSDGELKVQWDPVFLQDLSETPIDLLEEEIEAFLQRFSADSPIAVAALRIPLPTPVQDELPPPDESVNQQIEHENKPQLARKIQLPRLNLKPFFGSTKLKLIFLVGFLVIILAGFFGFTQFRKESQKNSQINNLIVASKQDFNQAMSQKDTDPDGARASLAKSKQELQQALGVDPKSSQAKSWQDQMNSQTSQILKQFQITNFPVFLDLSLVKPGFSTQRLSFSLGKMAFLDPKQKTLVVIDVAEKNPQILAGQLQLGDAQLASINGNKVFIYSSDKGVIAVDVDDSKISTVAKPDSSWERISDITGFANNIYLLDEFKNQIWKYIATDSGFSDRNEYLKSDTVADFAGIKKMQIDGSVWVLKSDSTILKFIQGGSDFFLFKGFDQPMDNIKSFYVSDDTANMYFLDNDHGRVVVTKKDGQYLAEYTGDKFKTADDLAVDEQSKKLYLLEGGKIYQVELQ